MELTNGQNPKGKRELQKEEKLSRLRQASLECFLERGFHPCRIEDIADRANVAKGTFYLYFKDKEDVLISLIRSCFAEVQSTLEWTEHQMAPNASVLEIFIGQADRIYQTLLKHRETARIVYREGPSAGKAVADVISGFYQGIYDLSEKNIALAIEMGLMPQIHPKIAARCILGSIETVYREQIHGNLEGADSALLHDTLQFCIRGCGLTLDATSRM